MKYYDSLTTCINALLICLDYTSSSSSCSVYASFIFNTHWLTNDTLNPGQSPEDSLVHEPYNLPNNSVMKNCQASCENIPKVLIILFRTVYLHLRSRCSEFPAQKLPCRCELINPHWSSSFVR